MQETFELFRLAARLSFPGMPEPARLIYFVGDRAPSLNDRKDITDNATYATFLTLVERGTPRVTLFVHPAATSPTKVPAWPSAADSASQGTKSVGTGSVGKGSARSSAVQDEFVDTVRMRDGLAGLPRHCAACGGQPELLQVAHIVSRKTDLGLAMREFGLGGINIAQNGMQLCEHCHYWYDKYLWWVEVRGGVETIIVSDAMLADEADRPVEERHFTALHNTPMRLPPLADRNAAAWPAAVTWTAQQRACVKAREARHADRENRTEECERCHKPYSAKAIAHLRRHQPECVASVRQK